MQVQVRLGKPSKEPIFQNYHFSVNIFNNIMDIEKSIILLDIFILILIKKICFNMW